MKGVRRDRESATSVSESAQLGRVHIAKLLRYLRCTLVVCTHDFTVTKSKTHDEGDRAQEPRPRPRRKSQD